MEMTKERLRRYRTITRERAQLRARLTEIETPLYSPKVQQFNGMPHVPSPTGSGSQQEQIADRTMELREWYRSKIHELVKEELAIEKAIEKLDPTSRMLMRHRYINGLSWEDICKVMHYSKSRIHEIHGAALQKIKEPED